MTIVGILWLVFVAYLVYAARNVRPIERRESVASRLTHVAPLTAGCVLLAVKYFRFGWLDDRFPPEIAAVKVVGILVTFTGIALAIWARHHLGENWSGTVTLKVGHKLVRSGPYAFLRHPMYAGLVVAFLGTAVVEGEWRSLAGVGLVALAFWRKSRIENTWLASRFGAQVEQ